MIKAKKSLGQNFLVDENVINKITNFLDIENKEILEVGPGTGNLTTALLKKKPNKFYVIEKDNELVTFLNKKFNNQLVIINDDILDINENLLSREKLIVFGKMTFDDNLGVDIIPMRNQTLHLHFKG